MAKFNETNFKDGNSMCQNSIEDLLSEGETILWRGKPNRKSFIASQILKMLPVVIIWLIFDGVFIGTLIGFGIFGKLPTIFTVLICLFFAFHLLPLWIWIANIVTASKRQKNMEYAFTNRRIICRDGIIGVDINNIFYTDIKNVNLKVGLIDKWMKTGDIYITSQNKAQVLWDIEDPYSITSRLQKIISDIQTDIYYPNALRPETNEGYKTNYKEN